MMDLLLFASIVLVCVLPPACFVLSWIAVAIAGNPPDERPSKPLRTWKMLGASLAPLPLVLLGHVVAPDAASSVRLFANDFGPIAYCFVELLAVATPILFAATWFRRIAPSRSIRILVTIVAIGIGVWSALADLLDRTLSGI